MFVVAWISICVLLVSLIVFVVLSHRSLMASARNVSAELAYTREGIAALNRKSDSDLKLSQALNALQADVDVLKMRQREAAANFDEIADTLDALKTTAAPRSEIRQDLCSHGRLVDGRVVISDCP